MKATLISTYNVKFTVWLFGFTLCAWSLRISTAEYYRRNVLGLIHISVD